MWSEIKNGHYELFYITGSFALQNFTDTYVDNPMFCSYNYDQYSKSKEIFSIGPWNKIEKVLPKYSLLKIISGIKTPSPQQEYFPPVIPSGNISPIPMGTKSKIPSGDFFLITPRDFSKTPEDNIDATFKKSVSSAHNDYKIHLLDPGPTTTANPNSDFIPNPVPYLKLR